LLILSDAIISRKSRRKPTITARGNISHKRDLEQLMCLTREIFVFFKVLLAQPINLLDVYHDLIKKEREIKDNIAKTKDNAITEIKQNNQKQVDEFTRQLSQKLRFR
jgi:hypothetical protein